MHLARRNRDLPTNDRERARRRKNFRSAFRPEQIDHYAPAATVNIDTSGSQGNGVRIVMRTILLIVLILLLIGLIPAWPYSTAWGYYPSGGVGIILLIVVLLALTGRL